MIWVILNLHFDADNLLQRFIKYYTSRGVDCVGIIARGSIPYCDPAKTLIRMVSGGYVNGPTDNEQLNEFRRIHLSNNDWYIPADLDEYYWSPGLSDFRCLTGNWDYIPAKFVDRVSANGEIPSRIGSTTLDDQFPLGGSIIRDLCGRGCEDKVCMARGNIPMASGHHFVASPAIQSPFTVQCHHFKWGGRRFWEFMNARERMVQDTVKSQFPAFRAHYVVGNRINVFDSKLGMYNAPPIGV